MKLCDACLTPLDGRVTYEVVVDATYDTCEACYQRVKESIAGLMAGKQQMGKPQVQFPAPVPVLPNGAGTPEEIKEEWGDRWAPKEFTCQKCGAKCRPAGELPPGVEPPTLCPRCRGTPAVVPDPRDSIFGDPDVVLNGETH